MQQPSLGGLTDMTVHVEVFCSSAKLKAVAETAKIAAVIKDFISKINLCFVNFINYKRIVVLAFKAI